MADLPPYIYKEKAELLNNNERVVHSVSFFYCSVCNSSFRKPRTPEVHCAGPVHIKNVQRHREKKEERRIKFEREIEEMRIKFQEKEESIAEQQGLDVHAAIQKEKEKIITAFRHTT